MPLKVITAHPVETSGTLSWYLCHDGYCGGPGNPDNKHYPVVTLEPGARNTMFVVNIEDPTNAFGFSNTSTNPHNGDDAIYLTPGSGQHPGQGNNSHGQIHNVTLATPKTLVFNNKNSWKGTLSYALNFQKNGQPVTSIDPDIRNGGGGGGNEGLMLSASATTLVIGAAVAIALIAGLVSGLFVKKLG